MNDLKQYKPGQRITSMSRARFLQLWQEIKDGTLNERWSKGKEPETRKERTEAMQIKTMTMLYLEHRDMFDLLLESEDWLEFEVVMGRDGLAHARALRKRRRRR